MAIMEPDREQDERLKAAARARVEHARDLRWRRIPAMWRALPPIAALALLLAAGIDVMLAGRRDWEIVAAVVALVCLQAFAVVGRGLLGRSGTEQLLRELWVLFYPWLALSGLLSRVGR
jgi:hypothetical protein